MDPPSPLKFPMSPGMPVFPVSPERVAGTKPLYNGPAPPSPSLPDLRTAPLRAMSHRRNDSDVSVHGLAAMFENLEVKDPREAQAKYMKAMQKQKDKHMGEVAEIERKHQLALGRWEIRCDELKSELKKVQETNKDSIARDVWNKERQDHREALAKWEKALQKESERRKLAENAFETMRPKYNHYKTAAEQYKKQLKEVMKEKFDASASAAAAQVQMHTLNRKTKSLESDLKYQSAEAEKYKSQVYGLQVDLESVENRLTEQNQSLSDKLRLIEGERDALKTSLKEEEVLRIAAEGQIPLPIASTEEEDEFASPVRSPRKRRTPEREEEDKENVAPKKAMVEIRLLQQELASEKRLRERAHEQIDFMKMECQFQCCSCRIADLTSARYFHDDHYAVDMERIKASVPFMTPPASDSGNEPMDDILARQEPVGDGRPVTPPAEPVREIGLINGTETLAVPAVSPEPAMAFSPTTGTFRAVSSPVNAASSAHIATPARQLPLDLPCINELATASSPWTPDANSTVLPAEPESPSAPEPIPEPEHLVEYEAKSAVKNIIIHEDAIIDEDEENDSHEPQTPLHEPTGPATPAQLLHTITTTTTIPLRFSPLTPATKCADQPLTPSTIAHVPRSGEAQILGEISLNKLPFDREAALEAIRLRRGRTRSMAAGHGTPRKQMLEGVKERRDISAPVSRVRH